MAWCGEDKYRPRVNFLSAVVWLTFVLDRVLATYSTLRFGLSMNSRATFIFVMKYYASIVYLALAMVPVFALPSPSGPVNFSLVLMQW